MAALEGDATVIRHFSITQTVTYFIVSKLHLILSQALRNKMRRLLSLFFVFSLAIKHSIIKFNFGRLLLNQLLMLKG